MTSFTNLFKIIGSLATDSPLHIGNGNSTDRPSCEYLKDADGATVEISAVATDAVGRAYVPGTVLKGNLRAWAKRHSKSELWGEVFGLQELGGKAEFWDAHCSNPPPSDFDPGRCWSPERLTSVAASVNIDRRTRTARDKLLFHREFVPKGIAFDVRITAKDLTDPELALLLRSLAAFNNDIRPVTLGAKTSDNWGRLKWRLHSVRQIDSDAVAQWLKHQTASTINECFDAFSSEYSFQMPTGDEAAPNACVSFEIDLEFAGLFLVNDSSQIRTGSDPLGHAPVTDESGSPVLPASSFRGALRNQAEMILRTIGGPLAAWRPGERGLTPSSETIAEVAQLSQLCLSSQIFGAPGWRTPLQVTNFTLAPGTSPQYITHEMLAIDRFTGGSPAGLKFNAKAVCQPILRGTVTIDLAALDVSGAGTGGLLLLIYTLRDLMEGDIVFGFGAGKGYGACRPKIRTVHWPKWADIPEVFRRDLSHKDLPNFVDGASVSDELLLKLEIDWYDELRKSVDRRAHAFS